MKNLIRKLIVQLFLLFPISFSFAQTATTDHKFLPYGANAKDAHKHFVGQLLQRQSCKLAQLRPAAKTSTETAERLIAQSWYNIADSGSLINPIGVIDSAKYKYSSSRSSIFNYNTMVYDNTYYINGSDLFGFGAETGFPDHNNAPNMLCDSAWLWQIDYLDSPFNLVLWDIQHSLYDTNYNVVEYADDYNDDSTTFESDNRYINTFNSSANILNSFALSWDYGSWDTSEYRTFTYDGSNLIIKDTTNSYMGFGIWVPEEAWYYALDDSGNITQAIYSTYDGSLWQELYIYTMTYYSNNAIKTDSVSTDTGSAWIPMYKDTFGYTSGINYATYLREYIYNDSLHYYFTTTKHISGIGLPDTMYQTAYIEETGAIISGNKDVFLYDSYDEPTTDMRYNLKIDTTTSTISYDATIDYINYYYYELYYERHAPNAVPTIPATPEQVMLYPNPTTNTLNICRPNATKGAYTLIKLINAAGQTVHIESLPWQSETETVSMAGLAPGVYWLTIQAGGNIIYRQSVVKE